MISPAHETLLGLKKAEAGSDLALEKHKKRRDKGGPERERQFRSWAAIMGKGVTTEISAYGSTPTPWYRWRGRGQPSPKEHTCINVQSLCMSGDVVYGE